MAYSEEALKAKLSTLNETQDSIVSVSQWITFHKRHADKIATYWLTRLRDAPPPKRLNFIYLVNDIVQNARARKRNEFPDAFAPLMPEAIQTAYRSSSPEVQNKIRRVIEVWRTRSVFEVPIQSAIEARLDETDKSKGSGGKKLMGNSLFSSSSSSGMPKELETLSPLQIAVTKATLAARPAIEAAQTEYARLTDPAVALPSPPVHAARLSSLMKTLANAESNVSSSIKARQALVADLERILEINKAALAKDEETYLELDSRRTSTEAKKREVEDNIMRGLSTEPSIEPPDFSMNAEASDITEPQHHRNGSSSATTTPFNPERPDFEELTPEPDDDFSAHQYNPAAPANNPSVQAVLAGFGTTSPPPAHPPNHSTNSNSKVRSASNDHPLHGSPISKRRKMSHNASSLEQNAMPDFGEMGIDISGFGGGNDNNGPIQMHQGVASAGDDILQSLDQDVNDLIRQGGGI